MTRPSSIDRLPPDVLEKLHELLRDPRVTQLQATAEINEVLQRDGLPDRVSKSAVGRYAARMEQVGEKLRQSREVAAQWIGKLGATPQGQVGHLVNEILRTLSFDLALKLQDRDVTEEDLPGVIEMVRELSLGVMRLEKAASENVARERELKKQAAEELTSKVEGETGGAAITPERLREIVRETYGV